MKRRFGRLALVARSVLAGCGLVLSQAQAQGQTSPLATGLGEQFASETATVNGITLQDVYQLASALKLGRVQIVGHDIGGMVAYAFVRIYPQVTRGAMVLDVPLPGVDGGMRFRAIPASGTYPLCRFRGSPRNSSPGGRPYFGYFFNFSKFAPGEVAHYVKAYATPAQLHAAFEMYRAFPANAQFNAALREPNDVPLFLGAGEKSPLAKLVTKIAEGLRTNGFHACRDRTDARRRALPRRGSAGGGSRSHRTICLATSGMTKASPYRIVAE
jgi:pimeloyl-ACP methyl ester carboxylesterase